MAIKGKSGGQFVTLYRGLHGVTPEEVGQRGLGSHWTTEPHIASDFAQGFRNYDIDLTDHEDFAENNPTLGTVIQAKVHKRHIIDRASDEGEGWADFQGVLDEGHSEAEQTVRPGAIVHVQKMAQVEYPGSERLVTPKSRRGWRA